MNEFDINKRFSLQVASTGILIFGSGGIIKPAQAQLDPISAQILLGIIAAFGAIFSAKVIADGNKKIADQSSELQILLAQMQQDYDMRKAKHQLGQISIQEEVAFDNNGRPARKVITRNIDNSGTEFGLSNGRLADRRRMYSGDFYSIEGARFSKGIERGYSMPVPVDNMYRAISPAMAEEVTASIGRDKSLLSRRRYSSAKEPTQDGWDLETVLYANSDNTVDAKIVQRNRNTG